MEVMLMMSVSEYASDVNLSVNKVLKLCNSLGIDAKSEDDMLDDDAIIMLDNEITNISDEIEEVVEDVEEVEENDTTEDIEEEHEEVLSLTVHFDTSV